MSHTTKIKQVPMRSESAMRAAIAALKAKGVECSLLENVKPRMYYADQHKECPLVLHLPQSRYDVGFDRQDDGTLIPVFDGYRGDVGRQIGVNMDGLQGTDRSASSIGQLLQEYSKAVVIETAAMNGQIVDGITENADGTVCVQLSGM